MFFPLGTPWFPVFAAFAGARPQDQGSAHSASPAPFISTSPSSLFPLEQDEQITSEILSLNSSLSGNTTLNIRCSGRHFGFHLSVADCQSAKEYVEPDAHQYNFGERHAGLRVDVPLPYRVMGGTLAAPPESRTALKSQEKC